MTHDHTFIDALRRRGYRITPQREMVVEAIANAGCHITAEQIFNEVSERVHGMNITTVYRTLDLLVEEGLISRLDLGHCEITYATLQHGPHLHLVCRQCGYVMDADAAMMGHLNELIQQQYGFTADLQHAAFTGLCSACRGQS
jgi:Fur family ferric uptake transcriptional regulator